MLGLIFSLLVGALAGYIAGRIMGSETSAVRNIVLGILGGCVWQHPVRLTRPECHGPCGEIRVSLWSVPVSVYRIGRKYCSSKRLNTTIKNTSAFV